MKKADLKAKYDETMPGEPDAPQTDNDPQTGEGNLRLAPDPRSQSGDGHGTSEQVR